MAGLLLCACLDIPEEPEVSEKITSVNVVITQNNQKDSTLLKITSNEKATISAHVHPNAHRESLEYLWLNRGKVIGEKSSSEVDVSQNAIIPDSLVIRDPYGNTISKSLRIIVNTPPTLSKKTVPADGDTVIAQPSTPILFQWNSSDPDYIDNLNHILEIDGVSYKLGNNTSIRQSGFSKGKHSFRILVSDAYGDKDSTAHVNFYVKEQKEASNE